MLNLVLSARTTTTILWIFFQDNLLIRYRKRSLAISGFLMAHDWLLELFHSRLLLCDHQPACSSHTDESESTQHPLNILHGMLHDPPDLPPLGMDPQYAGLHTLELCLVS